MYTTCDHLNCEVVYAGRRMFTSLLPLLPLLPPILINKGYSIYIPF